jgi:cysteine-rich repeat protein
MSTASAAGKRMYVSGSASWRRGWRLVGGPEYVHCRVGQREVGHAAGADADAGLAGVLQEHDAGVAGTGTSAAHQHTARGRRQRRHCGDGFVRAGVETCDDANSNPDDGCTNECVATGCGNGVVNEGEECDDGNQTNTDGCLNICVLATCGDNVVQAGVEACDDGNQSNNDGCSAACQVEVMTCGNGVIDPGERCDTALPAPFVGVGCKPGTCLFDFSQVTQLYCNGGCSWSGANDCDQTEADILCKLKNGNPNSVAMGWTSTTAQDTFGFACPFLGTSLGAIPEYGVNLDVRYQGSSILANHGPGNIILNPNCTNP